MKGSSYRAIKVREAWNRIEIVPGGYIVIVIREIDIIDISKRKDIG
jgi:uncharacterized protein (UPF0179 family)